MAFARPNAQVLDRAERSSRGLQFAALAADFKPIEHLFKTSAPAVAGTPGAVGAARIRPPAFAVSLDEPEATQVLDRLGAAALGGRSPDGESAFVFRGRPPRIACAGSLPLRPLDKAGRPTGPHRPVAHRRRVGLVRRAPAGRPGPRGGRMMSTYRPVDNIGADDADWLVFVCESGKLEAKHRRHFASQYFIHLARDDEIMDADIDLSAIPDGATIFASVLYMNYGTDLGQQRNKAITLFSVDPSLCTLVEKLNAAATRTLFRRVGGVSVNCHLVQTRSFPNMAANQR